MNNIVKVHSGTKVADIFRETLGYQPYIEVGDKSEIDSYDFDRYFVGYEDRKGTPTNTLSW